MYEIADYDKFSDLRDAFENGDDIIGKVVRINLHNPVCHSKLNPVKADSFMVGPYVIFGSDMEHRYLPNLRLVRGVVFKVTGTSFSNALNGWIFYGEFLEVYRK